MFVIWEKYYDSASWSTLQLLITQRNYSCESCEPGKIKATKDKNKNLNAKNLSHILENPFLAEWIKP